MFIARKKGAMYTAFLVVVLTLALNGFTPCSASFEIPDKIKTLTFLKNVVGIDMETYEILSFEAHSNEKSITGHVETNLFFNFSSKSANKIQVLTQFIDGTLRWCSLRVLAGTPMLKMPYANDLLNDAKVFLRRYSNHSNAVYCNKFTPLLDKISTLDRDQMVVGDDVSLQVKVEENYANFEWNYRVNGIDAPNKKVSLSFENGFIRGFIDDWGITTIGSTTLNVSEKEAENIALNVAEKYINDLGTKVIKIETTLTLYNDMDTGRGDYYTLYPRWAVMLHFDKVQSGNINGYYVAIWADTGEILHAEPQGYYGSFSPQGQLLDPRILAVIMMLPAVLAIAIIIYRKWPSKQLTYRQRRAKRL